MSQETVGKEKDLGTVAGKVEAVNDKKDREWYGICIGDDWFNGEETTDIEKGDTVELKVNDSDDFIDIESETVLQESSRESSVGGEQRSTSAQSSGGTVSPVSKTSRIVAQGAVKIAVHNADHEYSEDPKKHIEEVRERSQAYSGMIEDLSQEVENRGENQ